MSKPKVIFWHTYLINNFKLVVQEQMLKILTSGLYEEVDHIFTGILSPSKGDEEWFMRILKPYKKFVPIHHDANPEAREWHTHLNDKDAAEMSRQEKATMRYLYSFAMLNDAYIGYIHTKSITNPTYQRIAWRHSMDYAVLYGWKNCIKLLDEGADAVGPNLRYHTWWGHYPHFSGGYWWTTSAYIRTLDSSYLYDSNTKFPINRFLIELWIGSNPKANLKSVFECGTQFPSETDCTLDNYVFV